MKAQDVVSFLAAKGFRNLFAYHMPEKPDNAIFVEVRGVEGDVAMAYDTYTIHLIVRGPADDPRVAEDTARRAYAVLHALDGELIGNVYATGTWGTPPAPMGRDQKGRYEFTVNVQVETYVPDDEKREG